MQGVVVGLSLANSKRGNCAVLTATGAIDVHTAPQLRAALTEMIEAGASTIALDLGAVDFLDSSALGVLVGVSQELDSPGHLRIVCTDPRLIRLFEITHLTEVLSIVASVDEAVGR